MVTFFAHASIWRTVTDRRSIALSLTSLIILSFGCVTREALESERLRGAQAGQQEGWKKGRDKGYQEGYSAASRASHVETLAARFRSSAFRLVALYCVLAIVIAFLAGFGVQYTVWYVLRAAQVLTDVDGIVILHSQRSREIAPLHEPAAPPRLSREGDSTSNLSLANERTGE